MTGQTHQIFTKDPILSVFDDPQTQTHGDVQGRYRGWSYVTLQAGMGEDARYQHYAVCGRKIVELDFTGFRVMPLLAFQWMVKLDFPNRHDLAFCTHFNMTAVSALTEYDVERIWLWRLAQDQHAA